MKINMEDKLSPGTQNQYLEKCNYKAEQIPLKKNLTWVPQRPMCGHKETVVFTLVMNLYWVTFNAKCIERYLAYTKSSFL